MYRTGVLTVTLTGEFGSYQVPDFARIRPVAPTSADTSWWAWWTPRNADLLHETADCMYEDYRDEFTTGTDADRAGDARGWVAIHTKSATAAALATPEWTRKLVECFAALAERMEDGEVPVGRSFAEDVALEVLLDMAEADLRDRTDPRTGESYARGEEEHDRLPRVEDDYNFDVMFSNIFGDGDLAIPGLDEAVFDAGVDLTGHPAVLAAEVATALGSFGASPLLHPHAWFTPYDSVPGTVDVDRT